MMNDNIYLSYNCLVQNLRNGVDLAIANERKELTRNCQLVRSLNDILKQHLSQPKLGYWHIIRELTHSNTRKLIARYLKHVNDPYDRGIFWIYYTLTEGSFTSYYETLLSDEQILHKYYDACAILRNSYYSKQILDYVSGLINIVFNINESFYEVEVYDRPTMLDNEFENITMEFIKMLLVDISRNIISLSISQYFIFTSYKDNTFAISKSQDEQKTHEDISVQSDDDGSLTPVVDDSDRRYKNINECSNVNDLVKLRTSIANKKKGKRVSFHEDVLNESEKIIKKPILERHSYHFEDASSNFLTQLFGTFTASKVQEVGSDASTLDINLNENNNKTENSTIAERGVPEGQEDSNSEFSEPSLQKIKFRKSSVPTSKICLMKRFLKSVNKTNLEEKKLFNRRQNNHCLPIYIGKKNIDINEDLNNTVDLQILDEVREFHSQLVIVDDVTLERKLKTKINCDKIFKTYKCCTTDNKALLVTISDSNIIILSKAENKETDIFVNSIHFDQLDSVLIGPNSQLIMLIMKNEKTDTTVVVVPKYGECNQLCSFLEIAYRRYQWKNRNNWILNFRELKLMEMFNLKATRNCLFSKYENGKYYCWVNIVNSTSCSRSDKESYLMFGFGELIKKWLPGHICISNDKLTITTDGEYYSYSLGDCTTCDRIVTSRPHTFSVKFNNNKISLVIAMPDDFAMSDWMQSILQNAANLKSKKSSDSGSIVSDCNKELTGCSLIITNNYLLTVKFPETILNKLKISEISRVVAGTSYCLIDIDFHEVDVSNIDDWILYFSSEDGLKEFIEHLIKVRPALKKLILPCMSSDKFAVKCENIRKKLLLEFQNLILNI